MSEPRGSCSSNPRASVVILFSAVDVSEVERMSDATTVETRDATHVCKEIGESSGKPAEYFLNFANRKHLGVNDVSYHELKVLTKILEDAACCDQLNLRGNFFVETVARRIFNHH